MVLLAAVPPALHAALHTLEFISRWVAPVASSGCPSLHCPDLHCPEVHCADCPGALAWEWCTFPCESGAYFQHGACVDVKFRSSQGLGGR